MATRTNKNLSLSVIICTRNRFKLLKECLEHLEKGSCLPNQVVVIDSSESSKGKAYITRRFKKKFPEFVYKRVPHVNLAFSRNQGLTLVKGDIVAFIDDDSFVYKDWAFQIIKSFQEFPGLAGVGGFVSSLRKNYWSKAAVNIYKNNLGIKKPDKSLKVDGFAGLNCAFRRSFIDEHNIRFNETYATGEDIVFCYEIKRKKGELMYLPKIKVKHRFRTNPWAFFLRYYEYSLDEYRYWEKYPEFSGRGMYLPVRKLDWFIFPLFLAKRFVQNVYYFSSKNEFFYKYLPAVTLSQLAFFLGFYRQFVLKKLKKGMKLTEKWFRCARII